MRGHDLLLIALAACFVSSTYAADPSIWPAPVDATYTAGSLIVSPSLVYTFQGPASNPAIDDLAQKGFDRFTARTFYEAHVPTSEPVKRSTTSRSRVHIRGAGRSSVPGSPDITTLSIVVNTTVDVMAEGTNEAYTLACDSGNGCTITADTVFGALHGLESLSQLITFSYETKEYTTAFASCKITDNPRFTHRGLLIDTSRHFQPVRSILDVIDSMTYAKLNVLHWHIVDAQSFPLESKSYPKLWEGAWGPEERYSQEDVKAILEYAKYRGVRVIPEFDGPGHAYAWGVGYPEVLPAGYQTAPNCENKCPPQAGNPCDVPLDPSNNFTMQLVNGFLTEMGSGSNALFTDNYLHVGGDEVQLGCWENSPQIKQFMNEHGWTNLTQMYMYFVKNVHETSFNIGRTPVNWEEVFNHFGTALDKRTIIEIWLDHKTLAKVVAAGYKAILANQDVWYLDHLDTTWEQFYLNEPFENPSITDPAQQALLLGGEVCMWGETVDASDIQQTIWPRAAAGAERMWSPRSVNDTTTAKPRLEQFRCLLTRRGVPAAPVNVAGRAAPPEPGACPLQ